MPKMDMVKLSVVIPVKDEAESLPILYEQLNTVLKRTAMRYEIIFVDDGSTDTSQGILQAIAKKDNKIRIISLGVNQGKSAALSAGFNASQGKLIIMMDADLQDDPKEIPKFLDLLSKNYDMVTGWRKYRQDSLHKRISSYLFNAGTSLLTGIYIHDANCGFKAMTRDVAIGLTLHGELHRFIPIIATKLNYRIAQIPINHRTRQFGKSKFGYERGFHSILDLMTTLFITTYLFKPAHFFGKIGLALFSIGFIMDLYVAIIKIVTGSTGGRIPLLLAGILCMVLGTQLLSTGLIGEMIAHYFAKRQQNATLEKPFEHRYSRNT